MRGAVRRRGRMPPVAGSPWRLTAGAGLALTAVLFLLPLLTVRGEGGGAAGETENAPLTATAPEGQTTRAARDRGHIVKLLQPDGSAARQRLLQNLVRTISDKYFLLSRRVDLLVMKTLRAKVCAYLLSEAEQQGSMTFTIPFSRIQLADYLNCDRSALSRELSLMQRDGLLDTYRSSFKLLEPEALRQMIL